MFQILDLCTEEMAVVVGAVKTIFTLIQIAIPGVLIVLGTIDMFKAMASGDEKKTKEAQRTFIRRLIYAVVAFLIPFIIRLVFNFVANNIGTEEGKTGQTAYNQFFACWNGVSSATGGSNKSCWYHLSDGSWIQSADSQSECTGCWNTEESCVK